MAVHPVPPVFHLLGLALRKTLFCCAICILTNTVIAQQIILNTRGERIVVYPDGSWRYYERADSVLLNKRVLKENVGSPELREDTVLERSQINPGSDSDISALATRFGGQVATELINAKQALAATVEDKFEAEARLEQAEENAKLIEPDILATLDERYRALTQSVKAQQKEVQWIEKLHRKVQEMLSLPVERKHKRLNKLIAEHKAHGQTGQLVIQTQPVLTPKPVEAQRTSAPEVPNPRDSKAATSTSSPAGTIYRRAPVPCNLAPPQPGVTVAVQPQLFFTHTDEELRPYFRQQELVTCFAALKQIENNLYLSLEFQIASPDARKNFGILENNSMLRIKLISGTFVNLFNTRTDQGKIDAYTGNTVYTGNYLIDREAEKFLSKRELDKLRVVWSTGFEDYDVVNLDFLLRQFECLRREVQ